MVRAIPLTPRLTVAHSSALAVDIGLDVTDLFNSFYLFIYSATLLSGAVW